MIDRVTQIFATHGIHLINQPKLDRINTVQHITESNCQKHVKLGQFTLNSEHQRRQSFQLDSVIAQLKGQFFNQFELIIPNREYDQLASIGHYVNGDEVDRVHFGSKKCRYLWERYQLVDQLVDQVGGDSGGLQRQVQLPISLGLSPINTPDRHRLEIIFDHLPEDGAGRTVGRCL